MGLREALKLIGLSEDEFRTITIVNLSKQFARKRADVTNDEESKLLVEAFNFLKEELIQNKAMAVPNHTTFPNNFFAKVHQGADRALSGTPTLIYNVDGTNHNSAVMQCGKEVIHMVVPSTIKDGQTLILFRNGCIYDTTALVRKMTRKEFEEFLGIAKK